MPTRIEDRWFDSHGVQRACYKIKKSLRRLNVTAQEFKKSWTIVRSSIPDEELFYLFDNAFGAKNSVFSKMDFIKDILRRYKAMGDPVCLFGVPAYYLSVCSVSALGHVAM